VEKRSEKCHECNLREDSNPIWQAIRWWNPVAGRWFLIIGGVLAVLWQDRGIFIVLMSFSVVTITLIHYLCREVLRLRQRVEDLEHRKA
jgi:hypothetical protein